MAAITPGCYIFSMLVKIILQLVTTKCSCNLWIGNMMLPPSRALSFGDESNVVQGRKPLAEVTSVTLE